MDHSDFHKAVGVIAAGRYFTTQVEASTHSDGRTRVKWRAYIDGQNWTGENIGPLEALAELAGVLPVSTLADIGTSPQDTAAPFEPVAPVDSYAEEDAAPVS